MVLVIASFMLKWTSLTGKIQPTVSLTSVWLDPHQKLQKWNLATLQNFQGKSKCFLIQSENFVPESYSSFSACFQKLTPQKERSVSVPVSPFQKYLHLKNCFQF